ncbi:MAG: cysteine-rich VLP domain-containing protein [Oscillospiraceae bacterium]|nr:cysteine-rich VLP domain-containing protein [Oscillospiraceae bacterium]
MQYKEFTRREQQTIRRLVTDMCANYDERYGCLPLNSTCYMFTVNSPDSSPCKYFRNAVLPLNPFLETVFSGICETKPCKICGTEFEPVGRQAYCSEKCKHTSRRLTTAARVRKHRQKMQM